MKSFKLWLENKQSLAYHKTTEDAAESILQNGFDLSKSRKFELGLGVYVSLSPQQTKTNEVVIECQVSMDKFLDVRNIQTSLFTPEEVKILEEMTYFVEPNFSNSELAKKVKTNYRGLILNPRIIVCYYPEDVKPIKKLTPS